MSCKCTKKLPGAVDAPHLILPDEPCLFCAEKLRDIRHLVQSRESKIGSAWADVCSEIELLIRKQQSEEEGLK